MRYSQVHVLVLVFDHILNSKYKTLAEIIKQVERIFLFMISLAFLRSHYHKPIEIYRNLLCSHAFLLVHSFCMAAARALVYSDHLLTSCMKPHCAVSLHSYISFCYLFWLLYCILLRSSHTKNYSVSSTALLSSRFH